MILMQDKKMVEKINVQQKRQIILYKDIIDKIIDNGIRPNLLKLDKCAKIIRSNIDRKIITKEYLNSQLIIKQLKDNLNELQKSNNLLMKLTSSQSQYEYEEKVELIKKEVIKTIENFPKINNQKFIINDDDDLINNDHQQQLQIEKEKNLNAEQILNDVKTINQDLEDLNYMMNKFRTIVHEQQSTIDNIEQNIDNTVENVNEGTKSLAVAATSSVVPLACAAVGATIFGPIGAIISFKLSTGLVSALGGSIASYSLASYVKKRNLQKLKRHEEELNNDDEQQ